MDSLQLLFDGFGVALEPANLVRAFVGVLLGTAVGILPGIGRYADGGAAVARDLWARAGRRLHHIRR